MSNEWQSADQVQKNDAGDYRALIGGEWVAAQKAQKNENGEYRVILGGGGVVGTKQEPTFMDNAKSVSKSLQYASPLGLLTGVAHTALQKGNEALDKLAYSAGGGVSELATKAGLPPEAAGGLGLTANVGVQAIPALFGFNLGVKAAPMMESGAQKLMQSALKPDKLERLSGKGTEAVETMLTAPRQGMSLPGYNVSPSGVEKMSSEIGKFEGQLQGVLKNSAMAGNTVDKAEAASRVQGIISEIKKTGWAEQKQINTLETLYDHAIHDPNVPAKIAVDVANQMKRHIYEMLGSDFYAKFLPISEQVERQGRRAMAQGLRAGIEKAAPEVIPINAQMGPLINARDIAENRVLAAGNRDPLGLGALAFPTHLPSLLAWLSQRWPASLSMGARAMNSGSSVIPEAIGGLTGAVPGILSGRKPAYEENSNTGILGNR